MNQYEMYELEFVGAEPDGSQVDVSVEAEFTWNSKKTGNEQRKKVKGFYAGNGIYKVRFLPEEATEYSWKVSGCVSGHGKATCNPAKDCEKGIVHANGIHFSYEDGTIFHPIGTTIYALTHQKEELIDKTFETLKKAPFNKVRHCVFPKFYEYNKEDPQYFPFEKDREGNWDMNHPCFVYWERLEQVIFRLAKLGIQSDLILFHAYDKWGFAQMNISQCFLYLDYLLRRLSAIPQIWWSMANEFDLIYSRTMEEWYQIEDFIARNDPFHHLLSNHNCFSFYDFSRPNITHCCVQALQMESAAMWMEKYQKPLIYDECCYEGNLPMSWGSLSGFEMVSRFWQACVSGAYASHGEVFMSEDDILWWSKGGELKGSSPRRIAFLKEILEELPGPLKPWYQEQWELPDMGYMTNAPEDLYKKLHSSMPPEQQESMRIKDGVCCGHVGNQAFMEYFGHRCCGMTRWVLPENHTYRIEEIDIWDMTRKTTYRGVNGKIAVKLPGKEGIALLAIAEN